MCGIESHGAQGKSFHIKYFAGDDYLVVQLFKDTWRIPRDQEASIILYFDRQPPWRVRAIGVDNLLEFRVEAAQLTDFMRDFGDATSGLIDFVEGNEGRWTMDLYGSGNAVDRMAVCIRAVGAGATQPFGASRRPSRGID